MAKIYSGLTAGIKLTQDSAQDIAFLTGFELKFRKKFSKQKLWETSGRESSPVLKRGAVRARACLPLTKTKRNFNQLLQTARTRAKSVSICSSL